MEEKIKYSIEKVIMKKYPAISGVESVKDLFTAPDQLCVGGSPL